MVPTDSAVVGVLLASLGAIGIAVQSLSIRLGTDEGRVSTAMVVVLAVNILAIVPAAIVLYYPNYSLSATSVVAFVAAGMVGTLLGRIFYFTSIERIGASRSEPLKASQPLHATLIAVVVLHERVTAGHVVGILLIVLGIAVVSWESARTDAVTDGGTADSHDATAGDGSTNDDDRWLALALPLAAAFFFGIEPTLAKIGFGEGTPLVVGLAIKTVAASVGFLGYLWWKDELPGRAELRASSAKWYVVAGLANTAFLVLYYAALSVSRVSVVVPVIQTSPLVVMVLSAVFLSRLERVTWRLVTAASIVAVGAIVLTTVA